MKHLSNDHKDYSNQRENSQAMQWNGALRYEFDETSMEIAKTTWSKFPYGGKAIVEQILASE